MATNGPGVNFGPGCDHLFATYYDRPWRRLFRKRIVLACWYCDETWPEPT